MNDVCTDDDEVEYEAWTQRELKRDREKREQLEKEHLEIENIHNDCHNDWQSI